MRTTLTLLALALVEVSPAVAHADTPPATRDTRASVASQGGDLAGRLGYESAGPFSPSVTFVMRAAAGHDDALLGPLPMFYRAQPEFLFGLKPRARLALFAGGGVGAAYLVPDAAEHGAAARPTVTVSGVLGARFPWERVPVTAVTRAESVRGGGTAVTLNVALAFADRPL